MDPGVLRPFEMEEYIRSDESGFRRENEKRHVEKVIESAQMALISV